MGEIDVLEAQLEHRRSDLNDVIQHMEQVMLAQANGEEDAYNSPPRPSRPDAAHSQSRTSTPSTPQRSPPPAREIPDYSGGDLKIDDRVMVMIRGEFKGRKGVVEKLLGDGRHFVKVLLDPRPGAEVPERTTKAPESLQRLNEA